MTWWLDSASRAEEAEVLRAILRDDYDPPPWLKELAKREPDAAWLCYLPPAERQWWARDFHGVKAGLEFLVYIYPGVTGSEWRRLFP